MGGLYGRWTLLLCCSLWLAGCHGVGPGRQSSAHPPGPHTRVCQLIASTTELPSATRPQVFRELAARPDLRSHDQVYLTNALMAEGRGRDSASILVVLAANRALTPVGRRHLLSAMDGLASAYDRARVMQALNDNR